MTIKEQGGAIPPRGGLLQSARSGCVVAVATKKAGKEQGERIPPQC